MKGKISKSPSYLIRNPYTYCFRMNVPKDLQPYIGKKELRYSLRTGYLGVAKEKARYVAGHVQSIFRILRKGTIVNLSDDQIKELVKKYIKDSLENRAPISMARLSSCFCIAFSFSAFICIP